MRYKIYMLSALLFLSKFMLAQTTDVLTGYVHNEDGIPLGDATVQIGNYGTTALSNGYFSLKNIPTGKHLLVVSAVGYAAFQDTIVKLAHENLALQIRLSKDDKVLQEVTVVGKSETQQVREQAIRAVVVDTRAVSTRATTLTDLMNRSTGVRIRQNGGLGSRPEISINGFQGKAIKYFKDGIPLDYMGDGYNIASLPLEALERIEVFKGVLPVSLGADALGGAVNLVTARRRGSHMHAFYEIGSFNTHRAGVTATHETKNQKWSYGTELFFNHSDNDYDAFVGVRNPNTANLEYRDMRLFHNAFQSYYGEAYVNLQNRNWVDELRLSLTAFALEREQQHPALMTDAYGAVLGKQQTVVPSLRYKKKLLDGKLSIDQFAAYNNLQTRRIDTLMGRYDWYGEFTPKTTPGESRLPSLSKIHERQVILRTNIGYQINPTTSLDFNYVFTDANRDGEDPYGQRLAGTDIDVLSLTSTYQKQVFGLSLDKYWMDEKLHNQLMAKFYRYSASGIQNTWFSTSVTDADKRQQSGNYWGVAEALRYRITPSSFVRGSLEYTYRLPEREELFGNNIFIVPNFELNPEKSFNASLGYQQTFDGNFTVEANGFYRRTKGLILLVPIQAPNAQYQNQEHVKGFGFDLDMRYRFATHYTLSGNATWQNLRLFGITHETDQWKNDARLRNTPYFFANAGIQSDYDAVFAHEDNLKVFVNYNFLREFYLETIRKDLEPGGFLGLSGQANINSNLRIPDQHLLNAGFTYKVSSGRINLGAEVRNLLDKDLYDYYRIQRPGRSFHLKVSYGL
ncbi:TonB-dependent receptor plug domain-containing protein [Sphingobacterium corticibacterium]|uniref:TonB-dependent receptor n=1 Tax=Sphingobacterium corticibacterium TaxID=2484746 RepID=A0A4Q6XNE1_9SPHI|nr:TonB-dependent receptor plug domain-containing protein [Sphingobacterium corticibacterium]RZF57997.1 TonB-dependent receptor [Sphingobacterium corticibacterium]